MQLKQDQHGYMSHNEKFSTIKNLCLYTDFEISTPQMDRMELQLHNLWVLSNLWLCLICSAGACNNKEGFSEPLSLWRHLVPTKTEVNDPQTQRDTHAASHSLRGLWARGSRAHHLITVTAVPSGIIKGKTLWWDSWREVCVVSVLELLNISWMRLRGGESMCLIGGTEIAWGHEGQQQVFGAEEVCLCAQRLHAFKITFPYMVILSHDITLDIKTVRKPSLLKGSQHVVSKVFGHFYLL